VAGIVAIGASQGGVQTLRRLVAALPRDFRMSLLVVLHIGASRSLLPSLLNDAGGLEASHAADGEPVRDGHIHVAPPDYHMLVANGRIRLSRGPRENWARPAIDPLFRSVAESYGPEAVGIVLTGALNDGTAGLFQIKRRGGIAVVQDPKEAEAPSMPLGALETVAVDYCLPIDEIARLLVQMSEMPAAAKKTSGIQIMAQTEHEFVTPAAQTCP
jgi:two-component system chemotaxis response regulator CheB